MGAINGQARGDMVSNPEGCGPKEVAGHCGHKRGLLAECRCTALDRIDNPGLRYEFENRVINKILSHPKIQASLRPGGVPFKFNLAIFCSGMLLGEQILLFRLLDSLNQTNAAGTINLFLIDRIYKYPMKTGNVDKAPYLKQFLEEICSCLPPSLEIKGTIYGEADDYINQAQRDATFKHDLVIGSDIDNTVKEIATINEKARANLTQEPLILIKSGNRETPLICDGPPFTKHCDVPSDIVNTCPMIFEGYISFDMKRLQLSKYPTPGLPLKAPSQPLRHSSGPSIEQWVFVAILIAALAVIRVSQASKR
jgi:hypothetical protein